MPFGFGRRGGGGGMLTASKLLYQPDEGEILIDDRAHVAVAVEAATLVGTALVATVDRRADDWDIAFAFDDATCIGDPGRSDP